MHAGPQRKYVCAGDELHHFHRELPKHSAGPELSEIDQGCSTSAPTLTICAAGQYGCTQRTQQWSDSAAFVAQDITYINTWSGLNGCTQQSGQGNLPAWKAMSVVDGSSGSVTPVFTYPNTTMHGWLCAGQYQRCSPNQCPNNSAAEGNFYYTQFPGTQGTGPKSLGITGVLGCVQAEGVTQGTDPDSGGPASLAIGADMKANCQPQQ